MRWWRLAARNLLRHRRRSILTGTIVMVGFVAITMMAGFVAQTFHALASATIRGAGGHLRILDPRAEGKTDDEAASILIPDWRAIAAEAKKDLRVVQAMPKLSFFGLVAKGEKSAAYLGTGVVPALDRAISPIAESLVSGRLLQADDADEVLLGTGLARAVGAKAGDLVTVMTTTPDGSLNAVDATVDGLVQYPIREFDDRFLEMPFAAAGRLLKAEGSASTIAILLKDDVDPDVAARDLKKALAAAGHPVVVKTWIETAAFYKQVKLLYQAIFLFVGIVLAVVVVLSAANTMTMSVFERTREIGALLAMGMDRSRVRRLFLYEGTLMGLFGCVAGAVASLLLRAALNAAHLQLPPPPGATRGGILHVELIPLAYGIGFAVMTLTLVVAALWPARRAARLSPVEALAHV